MILIQLDQKIGNKKRFISNFNLVYFEKIRVFQASS